MSKRTIFPQQNGDRKKPRLDVSKSDHNFPLSQNAGSNKATDQCNSSGDDLDAEELEQAIHACEQALNSSLLPEYSQFKLPTVTSTQLQNEPTPGPSKSIFIYKTPSVTNNIVSKLLNDKCEQLSAPTGGVLKKVINTADLRQNYSNDKVPDIQDPDYLYRELLKVQEENTKLKSENGNLLEKCIKKEGEASILRTNLKDYKIAADNARLEKLKAQEQAQLHFNEQLNAVNNQLSDLQTQLDFKKLEIVNMKEKCKMLESNKIKLTQVTLGANDLSSHRLNTSIAVRNSFQKSQSTRQEAVSKSVQTNKNTQFFKLNKACRIGKSNLIQILPIVIEPIADLELSILEYNEKLKRPTDLSPNKCRIFSTFHRLLSSHNISSTVRSKINLSSLNENLTTIAVCHNDVDKTPEQYINIFNTSRTILEETYRDLETISKRLTSAFQKEMDKRYMETTTRYIVVEKQDLISGKKLFKEEQAIVARRMTALLHYILEDKKTVIFFHKVQSLTDIESPCSTNAFIELLYSICSLVENNLCAIYYSSLLLSIILLIENLIDHLALNNDRILDLLKVIITSRAMLFVPCHLLKLLVKFYKKKTEDSSLIVLCSYVCSGRNVRTDNDQGVIWFKKDSCLQQVLLKQVEVALKCMEKQKLTRQVTETARDLLELYSYCYTAGWDDQHNSQTKCEYVLLRIIIYALKICSSMLVNAGTTMTGAQVSASERAERAELLRVCRAGLRALYRLAARDVDLLPRLDRDYGHLVLYCDHLRSHHHNELYTTMLAEVAGALQADEPATRPRATLLQSFRAFSLTD